jgi:hypothetical protein
MDSFSFRALRRAWDQFCADNQAVVDWADDTEFRLSVRRRELRAAVSRSQRAKGCAGAEQERQPGR